MFAVFVAHTHRTTGNEIAIVRTRLATTRRLNGALTEHALFVAGAEANLTGHALPGETVRVLDLTAAAARAGLTLPEVACTAVALVGIHGLLFTVERI